MTGRDIPDECPAGGEHDWELGESGPIDRTGATRELARCAGCGLTVATGRPGSGVL